MEWSRYVPVAERRAWARREMNKLRKKGRDIQPVDIEGRTIARSFWGKRWCDHLESFSDYANRLPRGRTYVRNGSVCHLEIHPGRIGAIVSGSELYDVTIRISKLKAAIWKSIKARCSGQIGSMLELLHGRLSQQVMGVVTDRNHGLFPKPSEIQFTCSCPDWAAMCKHVASVLYGVGSRLDDRPESLFLLRGVDTAELIATEMTLPGDAATDDALADDALAGIFGIDLDPGDALPAPKAPAKPRKQARRRTASASGRQAPPAAKTQDLPASAAFAGRARKAASTAARGKKTSPAVTPRKRTAAKTQDLPASAASTGRARKAASTAARGKKTSPAVTPRKRTAAKTQDLPASAASAGRARKAASNATRGKQTSPTSLPRKRAVAKVAGASPPDIRLTGEWVARLRRRRGLSVARFAGQLGVSAVTVYRWEATHGPLNLHTRPLNALMALYRQSGKSTG